LLIAVSSIWLYRYETRTTNTVADSHLLKNRALADVERAESAYMQAIDKLAAEAKPQLENPATPLLSSYNEKLQILDSTIDDLRAQAGLNSSNAHLRYQLLAMYQEKQHTLAHFLGTIAAIFVTALLTAIPVRANHTAQEEATRNFDKTLTLPAGQSFHIEHKFGEVKIHGESTRELKIHATIRVQLGSRSEAESWADQIHIEVEQNGQGVRVRTVYPEKSWFNVRHISYSVDYDIAVPSDAPTTARNAFGNVSISGVSARTEIENKNGQVALRDSGPATLTNSFGAIEATNINGNATITNNNGTVTVSSVKGSLEIRNRFGNITAHNIQGALNIAGGNGPVDVNDAAETTVSNSFGPVTARAIRGNLTVNDNNGAIEASDIKGNATLNGSFGAITFSNISGQVACTATNSRVKGTGVGGNVAATTTFGEVSLDQLGGSVDVQDSNGRVTVHEVKGYAKLNTSFGAIDAGALHKGVRATTGNGRINLSDVDGDTYAKTSFGSIEAQRIAGNLTLENSNGPVGAGNIKGDVSARTSFGSVSVEEAGGHISVDNQNGSVSISAAHSANCKNISAKTSFSSIQVRLPENACYNVIARTSFGRIYSDLPITATGEVGGNSLTGKIGNGACTLSLTNSNGSIEIQKLTK
jgi:hypothetical protein